MTGIREKGCIEFRRMNGRSPGEAIGAHPPFQMESNHVVDRNLMINWKGIWSGWKCSLPRRKKSAAALSLPKRERKVCAVTCVWERNNLIVRSRELTLSHGTLTIFCCVRNSIPINMNFWAGIKPDFFRLGIKPRLCTVWRQYFVWDISRLRIWSLISQSSRKGNTGMRTDADAML